MSSSSEGHKALGPPVVQPTKIELIINLKTAKALDLTVSPTPLVAAADAIDYA
jgi:putative tryptophan/tyrosine transport system substrate-binding protein